jgi:CRP-like cAMP-binding protein
MNSTPDFANSGRPFAKASRTDRVRNPEGGPKPECKGCPVYANPLFRHAADQAAPLFACVFRPTHTLGNDLLFSEAGPADHLFALHSGLVKIVRSLESGKERIVRIVFPGTVFGFEALSSGSHSASALTMQKSEICSVSRDEFVGHLRGNPEFALNVVHLLSDEITHLSNALSNMSFKDARRRVATLLCSLLSAEAKEKSGNTVLRLPFLCQEIGEMLELSPETVSRTWSALERDGVIKKHGRKIIVQDVAALEKAAQR